MKCKACNDGTNQIKAGKTKAGIQKYKCKICGKYYTNESKKKGHSEEIKKQAIKLYLDGNSGCAVGRISKIGKNMCLFGFGNMRKILRPKRLQIRGVTSLKWTNCTASSREKTDFTR